MVGILWLFAVIGAIFWISSVIDGRRETAQLIQASPNILEFLTGVLYWYIKDWNEKGFFDILGSGDLTQLGTGARRSPITVIAKAYPPSDKRKLKSYRFEFFYPNPDCPRWVTFEFLVREFSGSDTIELVAVYLLTPMSWHKVSSVPQPLEAAFRQYCLNLSCAQRKKDRLALAPAA